MMVSYRISNGLYLEIILSATMCATSTHNRSNQYCILYNIHICFIALVYFTTSEDAKMVIGGRVVIRLRVQLQGFVVTKYLISGKCQR